MRICIRRIISVDNGAGESFVLPNSISLKRQSKQSKKVFIRDKLMLYKWQGGWEP